MEPIQNLTRIEEQLCDRATQALRPIGGTLELLPLCNMNCDMCYVRLSRGELERQGRLRTADEWLALAREMKKEGVLFLLLTGGEPLLYPDFRRLWLGLQELGMILSLNTNGTLLDEDTAAFLGAHKPRRVNITLYGCDDGAYERLCHYPGGFKKTMRGIRLLQAQGVDIRMTCTVSRENRDDLDRVIAIGKELGVHMTVDTYLDPAQRERPLPFDQQTRLQPEEAGRLRARFWKLFYDREKYRAMAEEMVWRATHTPPGEAVPGKVRCRAGRSSFVINWQGRMIPCLIQDHLSANAFEQGFAAAWQQITRGTQEIRTSPRCSACRLRTVCTACCARAWQETGAYDGTPEYLCRYTMGMIQAMAEDLEEMGVIKRVRAPSS